MIHHGMQGRYAIREGQWKLIMEGGRRAAKRELYDLSADPGEKNDLIAKHPKVAKRLAKRITEIIQNGRTTSGQPQPNDTPPWKDLVWMVD